MQACREKNAGAAAAPAVFRAISPTRTITAQLELCGCAATTARYAAEVGCRAASVKGETKVAAEPCSDCVVKWTGIVGAG